MKKKSLVLKIASCFMICFMSLLFVGGFTACDDPAERQESEESFDEEGTDDSSEALFDMYGTKVLYRPDSYDYNIGSGGTEESPNDYYGKYSYGILRALYRAYAIPQKDVAQIYLGIDESDYDKIEPYLYDSIRYNITAKGGDPYVVVADKSQGWNWSFAYDNADAPALLSTLKGNYLYGEFDDEVAFKSNIDDLYIGEYTEKYQTIYIGNVEDGVEDVAGGKVYSDYVKTLKYAIYCYSLDLEPADVDVKIPGNNGAPYSLTIDDMGVDLALDNIVGLFNATGSYVGLTQRQIKKIQKWILNNVIGQTAMQTDEVKYYSTIDVSVDPIKFESEDPSQNVKIDKNYETAVETIVQVVCKEVSIGSAGDVESGETGNIEDSFLASEIMEYGGDAFMISGNENFLLPCERTGKYANVPEKYFIQPREYQSAVLMLGDPKNPNEKIEFEEIGIALKYDADLDGAEEGVWDTSKYLDIIVELNYFNAEVGKMFTIGSQKTRVFDGPFDLESNNMPDGMYSEEGPGNVYFYDFAKDCPDKDIKNYLNENENLEIGSFKTDIGGGVLMTDVGTEGKYTGAPFISNQPLVLVGTNEARRYYELVVPAEDEDLGGQTYSTGRLNPAKFKGQCDYLEITYKVLKDNKADTNKNYKFFTGVCWMA